MSFERVFSIFKELNAIPRPSHHEEKVADFFCVRDNIALDYTNFKGNYVTRDDVKIVKNYLTE